MVNSSKGNHYRKHMNIGEEILVIQPLHWTPQIVPKYADPTGLAIIEKNDLFTVMFGISAFKTSIPSVFRRPKICSVLRDFICENELNRKYGVSIKYYMDDVTFRGMAVLLTHLQSQFLALTIIAYNRRQKCWVGQQCFT